jgi:hypothetical protein
LENTHLISESQNILKVHGYKCGAKLAVWLQGEGASFFLGSEPPALPVLGQGAGDSLPPPPLLSTEKNGGERLNSYFHMCAETKKMNALKSRAMWFKCSHLTLEARE